MCKGVKNTKVINIINDNTSYKNKIIDTISIISFEEYNKNSHPNDIILITTIINSQSIKMNLEKISYHKIHILDMNFLYDTNFIS
jgi:hypothetical protein